MTRDDAPEQRSERPNKSQAKREMRVLHDLVRELVALPSAKLDELPLNDALREGILSARKMKRAALARQLRYLTGLMRGEDAALVRQELQALSAPHQREVQVFHRLEQWREALLGGDEVLEDELVDKYGADRRHLRQLVRNARRERERGAAPKSARLLFKYLADLQDGADA